MRRSDEEGCPWSGLYYLVFTSRRKPKEGLGWAPES